MSLFHDKYEWLGNPEEDIEMAEESIVRYDDEGKHKEDLNFAYFNALCAIGKALVEIRDELRKMNGGGSDGNT